MPKAVSLSQATFKYSLVHRCHIASLHLTRYFARLVRILFMMWLHRGHKIWQGVQHRVRCEYW